MSSLVGFLTFGIVGAGFRRSTRWKHPVRRVPAALPVSYVRDRRTGLYNRRFLEENVKRLAVSVGVASFPQGGTRLDELLTAADRRLRAARRAGRSCVVAGDEEAVLP